MKAEGLPAGRGTHRRGPAENRDRDGFLVLQPGRDSMDFVKHETFRCLCGAFTLNSIIFTNFQRLSTLPGGIRPLSRNVRARTPSSRSGDGSGRDIAPPAATIANVAGAAP